MIITMIVTSVFIVGHMNGADMILMELNQDEVNMVISHRELIVMQERQRSERKNCHHVFVYDGHGHNYSVYKCTKCGEEEER